MDKLIVTTADELKRLITEAVAEAIAAQRRENSPSESNPIGNKYMTVSEAARYLNLAKQTIYGFTSSRTIPFIKRAKNLLFTKSDLDEWLEQGKKKSLIQLKAAIQSNGRAA